MNEELGLTNINDEQAREVGLPSLTAIEYMTSVASMLLTSNLLGPDMEPTKDAMAALKQSGWKQEDIDDYRDKVIRSNALAKMLVGREMGMQAMESLQSIDIVKGKLFVRYPAHIKQIERKGYKCTWVERSDTRAALQLERAGEDLLIEFTIEDAKRAGLANSYKDRYGNEANQYILRPRVMLTARVASEANRTTGGASTYTPEEKEEVLGRDSTMSEATAADEQRAAAIQEKYHVGVKADKQAESALPVQETKPNGKAADKPTSAPDTPPAPPKQAPSAPPQQASATAEDFILYHRDSDGVYIRIPGEQPLKHDVAKMRAQAIANQSGKACYAFLDSGDATAHQQPTFTAQPPEKPVPAEAKPAADPKQPSPLKKRLIAVAAAVAKTVNQGLAPDKIIPDKTVAARVSTFFVGYFGIAKVADLPSTEDHAEEYANAFADLESCAVQDANALLSAPEDTGKRMAANSKRLKGMLQGELKWPVANVESGIALARLRAFDFQDMLTFLENAQLIKRANGGQFESALSQDIGAALRMCLKTRQAGRFLRECASRNLSIGETLRWMEERQFSGDTLETRSEADVVKAIDWAMQAIAERAKAEEAKGVTPPMPPPTRKRAEQPMPAALAEAEDGDDNLFTDLP